MELSKTAKGAVDESPTVPYASLKSFFAGAVSGAVAKTAVAPLDRTKILMQISQMYGWQDYRGSVWSSMRTIWRTEGFFGFFRGNSATIARIMPYAAIQYSSFEFYHRTLSNYVFQSDSPNSLKRFMAGAMAGSTSVLCTYPFDLARTVLAVRTAHASPSRSGTNPGIARTLHSIVREEGITGVYRGMYPTLAGVIPYAGTSFLTYGVLRRAADRRGVSDAHPITTSLVCGGTAGLVAQCCTYPFDLVRRRLQALHKPELMTEPERAFITAASKHTRFGNISIVRAVLFIINTEGIRGLYRGIQVNFLKTAPAMSISFTCYDRLRSALGVPPGKYSATRG
ncbi:unnamed protein product [Agarophyton chilense]